jgi:uncharacterized protein YhdP
MSVRVKSGQFTQLEPGVGRLLGVLNLQALPRRITLDFATCFPKDSPSTAFPVASR